MEKKTHLKISRHTNQYREDVYLSSKLRLICDFLRYIDQSVCWMALTQIYFWSANEG